MIRITRTFALPDQEIEEQFIQSSGPGGQNVNKVATAVQLRFDIEASNSLPEGVKERLKQIASNQITKEGILIIVSKAQRTQERNRKAAREKFVHLVQKVLKPPKKRIETHPTKASHERRLKNKKIRSKKKQLRQSPPTPE